MKNLECDILIVGGGIAGLVSAKKASDSGKRVILVVNDKLGSGASYFPLKGTLGIQATDGERDRELFYEDIITVGKGMENPHMINTYIEEIDSSISYLNEIGFEPWLRGDRRPACFAKYPRKIYLIKDWEESRKRAKEILSSISNLEILEDSDLIRLIKKENRLVGAIIKNSQEFISISTPVVIMATGGVAGVYKNNLYPSKVIGSGHISLLDIGAKAQNMEFIQFIPAFIKPVYNTLFGEHTLKYCSGMYDLEDNLILTGVEDKSFEPLWIERSSYAPFSFDYPSHKIDLKLFEEIKRNGYGVKLKFLDSLYKDQGEFYIIFLKWLKEVIGIDMCRDEVIIAPFAHSCNGGIKIDEDGKTGIDGVYAIGELSSGVEGANRLGGNSMGASLVFGKRAVDSAINYLNNNHISSEKKYLEEEFKNWLEAIFREDSKNNLTYEEMRESLSKLISRVGNISRSEIELKKGLEELENLRKNFSISANLDRGVDIYFRIEVIKMLLLAMLERRESRGAHYREDFPYSDEKIYKVEISRENGEFILKKRYN